MSDRLDAPLRRVIAHRIDERGVALVTLDCGHVTAQIGRVSSAPDSRRCEQCQPTKRKAADTAFIVTNTFSRERGPQAPSPSLVAAPYLAPAGDSRDAGNFFSASHVAGDDRRGPTAGDDCSPKAAGLSTEKLRRERGGDYPASDELVIRRDAHNPMAVESAGPRQGLYATRETAPRVALCMGAP